MKNTREDAERAKKIVKEIWEPAMFGAGKEIQDMFKFYVEEAPGLFHTWKWDPFVKFMEESTLDAKTRELICIALLAMGRSGPGVMCHTMIALNEGASKEEIMDALHLAFYEAAGIPFADVGSWVGKAFEKWNAAEKERKGVSVKSVIHHSK